MPKTLKTISGDFSTAGIINKMQHQTPIAHVKEISLEEPLFLIFKIRGILKNGRTTLAITPIILVTSSTVIFQFIPLKLRVRLIVELGTFISLDI